VTLFRDACALLPKDAQRKKIEETINAATDALARADAQLAKDLG
jgi:hypothetical protein